MSDNRIRKDPARYATASFGRGILHTAVVRTEVAPRLARGSASIGIKEAPVQIATQPKDTAVPRLRLFGTGLNIQLSPRPVFRAAFCVSALGTHAQALRLSENRIGERAMTILKWALLFFVVSIVAGILGFTGVSSASADIARGLFYIFVVIFLVLLLPGLPIFRL